MSTSTYTRPAVLRPLVVSLALLAVLAAWLVSPVAQVGRTSGAVISLSESEPVMAGTATTSTSELFQFSSTLAGSPVRWNPCEPIHWQFRTAYAPAHSFVVVRAAVARISQVTGIGFVFDGPTAAVPTSTWLPSSTSSIRPLLIGWTDRGHSDLLRGQSSQVLGVTRTAYFGASLDGTMVAATKAAVIALDRTDRLPLTGAVSWSTVLQHELGHAMGLGHVGNARELMYPVLQRTLRGLQPGDIAGLHRLGRGAGCITLPF